MRVLPNSEPASRYPLFDIDLLASPAGIREKEDAALCIPSDLATLGIGQDDRAEFVVFEVGKGVLHFCSRNFAFMASTRASSPGCLSTYSASSRKSCINSAVSGVSAVCSIKHTISYTDPGSTMDRKPAIRIFAGISLSSSKASRAACLITERACIHLPKKMDFIIIRYENRGFVTCSSDNLEAFSLRHILYIYTVYAAMKTVTVYTIRYRLNGLWRNSLWKMSLDFAERQYDITQWEPLLETAMEMPVDEAEASRTASTSAFQRNNHSRPYADPKRPPILNWPYWPIEYPTDEDWSGLNDIWQRCKDYRPRR